MVKYAKGIALILEILGHNLRGKDIKEWEDQLERVKKVPIKKFHEIIRLSHNDLNRHEKRMLLDIACFIHYKKCCILLGAEALTKCKKPWQLDVCQEFCQEQNDQQICSSQMNMPGL